jgi:hypothetical protein
VYKKSERVVGYHGTYPKYVDSIKENNFFESENHELWIGDGVYFFVEGIGIDAPLDYARLFAIDQSYDKNLRKHTESEISVLEATIKINDDKFLDLTQTDGTHLFNDFRKQVIEKITATGRVVWGEYQDYHVFKIMRESLGIEFVKANVYIKFGVQRIKNFASNVPNVTIFVVNRPASNIIKPSIREVYKGGF